MKKVIFNKKNTISFEDLQGNEILGIKTESYKQVPLKIGDKYFMYGTNRSVGYDLKLDSANKNGWYLESYFNTFPNDELYVFDSHQDLFKWMAE